MFKFPVKLNKQVKSHGFTQESNIDMRALNEKDRMTRELNATIAHNKMVEEQAALENRERESRERMFAYENLQHNKLVALDKLVKTVPDAMLSEAFSHLYVKTCNRIHDPEYVAEHYNNFKLFGSMYIRKLGGMPYLKARVESTGSPFLKKFYTACDEAAKKVIEKKKKDIVDAISDQEAADIVSGAISEKDKKDLIEKIDDLGADQLAELIKNKVVDVVRDEQIRERDEREKRTDLKNDLVSPDSLNPDMDEDDDIEDTEESSKKKKKDDSEDADVDIDESDDKEDKSDKKGKKKKKSDSDSDDEDDTDIGDDDSDDEDSDKKKSGKKKGKKSKDKDDEDDDKDSDSKSDDDLGDLGEDDSESDDDDDKSDKKKDKKKKKAEESLYPMSKWNPITESFDFDGSQKNPKSFFYTLSCAIAKEMVISAHQTEGASYTSIRKKPTMEVANNPLNIDVFTDYMLDNQDGYRDIENSIPHDPTPLGGTKAIIDPDKIMTEALVQYTLFETANTIRLIDVTESMIAQQVKYLNSL